MMKSIHYYLTTRHAACSTLFMDGGRSNTTSVSISDRLPQRRKVLSLRYMGYEVPEIAQIMGIAEGTVQHHINSAVAASADAERISIVREAEISKLEEIENAFHPAATGNTQDPEGNIIPPQASAAKVVLDVMDRRAKLLGIDKAQPAVQAGNLTLIQILAQIPSPNASPGELEAASPSKAASPLFSREATDA